MVDQSWNVDTFTTVDLTPEEIEKLKAETVKALLLIAFAQGEDSITNMPVNIYFNSTGYFDSGVCCGPVERCYPPEEDDERTMVDVMLDFGENNEISLEQEIAEEIFEQFENDVYSASLPDTY